MSVLVDLMLFNPETGEAVDADDNWRIQYLNVGSRIQKSSLFVARDGIVVTSSLFHQNGNEEDPEYWKSQIEKLNNVLAETELDVAFKICAHPELFVGGFSPIIARLVGIIRTKKWEMVVNGDQITLTKI